MDVLSKRSSDIASRKGQTDGQPENIMAPVIAIAWLSQTVV